VAFPPPLPIDEPFSASSSIAKNPQEPRRFGQKAVDCAHPPNRRNSLSPGPFSLDLLTSGTQYPFYNTLKSRDISVSGAVDFLQNFWGAERVRRQTTVADFRRFSVISGARPTRRFNEAPARRPGKSGNGVNGGATPGHWGGVKPGHGVRRGPTAKGPIRPFAVSARWIWDQVISPVSGSAVSGMAWFCSAVDTRESSFWEGACFARKMTPPDPRFFIPSQFVGRLGRWGAALQASSHFCGRVGAARIFTITGSCGLRIFARS